MHPEETEIVARAEPRPNASEIAEGRFFTPGLQEVVVRYKGVVKREVIRVITPGTQLEPAALEAAETSYVMAIEPFTSIPGTGLENAVAAGTAPLLQPPKWHRPSAFARAKE